MKQLLTPLVLPLVLLPVASSSAQDIDYFSFSLENDVLFQEDGGYTDGVVFSWGYRDQATLDENNLPRWIDWLADKAPLERDGRRYNIDYGFGQGMQTAIDITQEVPPEGDAPYAGLLLWQVGLTSYEENIADHAKLSIGIVGPASGAEQTQKFIHELIDSDKPEGWDGQLENELVFRVEGSRNWRLQSVAFDNGTEFDVIGGAGAGVGNLRSDVGAGISVRWGQGLAQSFPLSSLIPTRAGDPLAPSVGGWQVYAKLAGSWVANEIFIDGNTFKDSASVDIIHGQAYATIGGAVELGQWVLGMTVVRGTDRYETQREATRFGSFNITYEFD
ncbi:hypothetical protein EDC56_3773 [Sinobacterium caligoides]|uniref:Lipid A deacylase LpxR family protein n=1 Tax=Sinobacterium caligoides TaxID=933926 RepID=A0A3N2D595_9GAMM|nr:lipid A deacylase LpxR family protein [Sinobacterium caligoides]ROR94957.1 hypothetical protein EDC56_3773 [Sinobacterium caligoides]